VNTNITYILYLRLCTRIITLSTVSRFSFSKISFFCLQYFFILCEYLCSLSSSSNMQNRSYSWSVVFVAVGFHRTQLTRVHHVSNDVHCRTRKRQQLTSARGFRERPRKGLQTMGRDGKGSRIITVQAPPSRNPFERLLSSVCVHMYDHLREYIVEYYEETPTNGYHK